MKKFLALTMAVLMLVGACVSLASCSSSTKNKIDFGKKYMLDEDRYYVFNKDNTGYYECYYKGTDYTLSGRVDFEWREASDGAVYLFEVDVEYNKKHTKGKKISLIYEPIFFSDEFFVYSSNSQYTGSSTTRYIKEGSELAKLIED